MSFQLANLDSSRNQNPILNLLRYLTLCNHMCVTLFSSVAIMSTVNWRSDVLAFLNELVEHVRWEQWKRDTKPFRLIGAVRMDDFMSMVSQTVKLFLYSTQHYQTGYVPHLRAYNLFSSMRRTDITRRQWAGSSLVTV